MRYHRSTLMCENANQEIDQIAWTYDEREVGPIMGQLSLSISCRV